MQFGAASEGFQEGSQREPRLDKGDLACSGGRCQNSPSASCSAKGQLKTAEGSVGQKHKKRLMAVTITVGSAAEAAAA